MSDEPNTQTMTFDQALATVPAAYDAESATAFSEFERGVIEDTSNKCGIEASILAALWIGAKDKLTKKIGKLEGHKRDALAAVYFFGLTQGLSIAAAFDQQTNGHPFLEVSDN